MNEKKAREILKDAIKADNSLSSVGWYLAWNVKSEDATLDGCFTVEDLLAIAWWMNNKKYKDAETN